MKATLTIDDDLLNEAEPPAAERSESVDVVISDLLGQSLRRLPSVRSDNGFPIFPHTEGTPLITIEDVWAADEL